MRSARATPRPAPGELVPIAERTRYLSALRAGFGLFVVGVTFLAPQVRGISSGTLATATGAYLLLLAAPEITRRLKRSQLLPVIGATLLLDGVYLGWVTYVTGGAQSPLRFLVYLHVVAVTLLGSYRTGLKIAAWHSLLLFVAYYAQSAGILEVRETLVSALPGSGEDFQVVSMLNVAALWAVALGTAMFSAVNERELRGQKFDLEHLSAMVSDIDNRASASDIPRMLLDRLCAVFGFTRGAVLASAEGNLSLMAYRGAVEHPQVLPGVDPVMERAWSRRQTALVRRVDAEVDPRVASLLPRGRSLMIVPLFRDRGQRLGILLLEHPGKGDSIKRWVVAIVEQFASHAALALHNAWLLEEIERQNQVLETKVAERTRELSDSLRDLQIVDEQRRRLLSRLVNAEEEERRRIANDIHDGPVQQVVVARMRTEMLSKELDDPGRRQSADRIHAALGTALDGLRDRLFQLRPTSLDHEGLKPALVEALSAFDGDLTFAVDARLSQEPPPELRIIVYRIAQEALANIRKHARATRIRIMLEEQSGGILTRVTDDGQGFQPPPSMLSAPGHLGMTSMRERAEMAGGWCRVHSAPGRGTTVEFWVPLRTGDRPAPTQEKDRVRAAG